MNRLQKISYRISRTQCFFGDDPAYAFEIEDIKLEQEPTTKNNLGVDCISRKQAIERLKLNYPISAGADNSKERYRYMQALADTQAIRELPPATLQEPRKGHWTCDRANVRCSCCGKGYKDFYGKARIASYNYCPNCGAKMESEDHK